MIKEKIQERISKLSEVGQHAFDGSDHSFGFTTWRSGTLTLLKQILPDNIALIKQIEEISLHRVSTKTTGAEAYNLNACKKEAEEILTIIISTHDQVAMKEAKNNHDTSTFWALLHPKVKELAKQRFDSGFYADSVVACLREANSIIKNHVRPIVNQELDGAALMTRAFSVQNPIIQLADVTTENGRNIQQGYMKMFEGAMIGIRNPKSHENLDPGKEKAIHFLFAASFLFIKLDDAGVLNSKKGA